jgi:hypothetical protein
LHVSSWGRNDGRLVCGLVDRGDQLDTARHAIAHEWRSSGSFNALRTQLVEVSRLVDVALNSRRTAKAATGVVKNASKATNIPKPRGRRR